MPDGINYFFDYSTQEIVFELQADFNTATTGTWLFEIGLGLPQLAVTDKLSIMLNIPSVAVACPVATITDTTQTNTVYEYEIGVDVIRTYTFNAFTLSETCASATYTLALNPPSFAQNNAVNSFSWDPTAMKLTFKHTNSYTPVQDYGDFTLTLRGTLTNGDFREVNVAFKIKLSCQNTPIVWNTSAGGPLPGKNYFISTSYTIFRTSTESTWNLSDTVVSQSAQITGGRTDCGPILIQITNNDGGRTAIDSSVFQHDLTAKTFHIGVQGMSGTATAGAKSLSAFFMF